LANFDFDQAEGLRRMLAGPRPRIVTFLSATSAEDRGAILVNLGASLARAGNDVLVVDACTANRGVSSRLGLASGPCLLDVARQECGLNQIIKSAPQGFNVVTLSRSALNSARQAPDETRRLAKAFDVLVKQSGLVIVDGELDSDESLTLPIMASNEIVVQVANNANSIKAAYCLIKHLNQELGRRPFGILVTGASEAEAQVVYDNMALTASRYLAVRLTSMGSVPADEYLHKAARLGRAVVDAFPLAGASVAFRRLAGRLAMTAAPVAGLRANAAHVSHFGI
jgi:flagellar biosynthesis protein FlhG